MKFPDHIRLTDDQILAVRQVDIEQLGYLDRNTGAIGIRRDQPIVGKHIVLIHELIHLTAEFLTQSGAIKRQPDEAFVTGAAPILLNLLTGAGLYIGITQKELHKFMSATSKTLRARRQRRQKKQGTKNRTAKPVHKLQSGRTGSFMKSARGEKVSR